MSDEQHPNPIVRWKHRRTMAYVALTGGVLFPLLILVTDNDTLAELAWPVYAFLGSIVGSYISTAAWETISVSKAAK